MHYGRISTIVGSVLAIIGLGLVSASSAAEEFMPTLNEATGGGVPAGFDRIVTAMWNDNVAGTAIFLIALVAVLGLSLVPNIKDALSRMNALIVTVLGVVMLVIGGLATSGALDDADTLEAAFGEAFAGGVIPGYAGHKHEMSAAAYVAKVAAGELYDATLSFQIESGFEARGVLENYLPDPAVDNWACFIVWHNPHYRDPNGDTP